MPLYEYQCKTCAHRFEKIQKFSDEPEKVCPNCGGVVERLLSAPAVQFKGAGWYVTDYAKKGATAKSGQASAGSEKKAESSSDSKPAAAESSASDKKGTT